MKGKLTPTTAPERLEKTLERVQRTLEEMPRKYPYAFGYQPWKRFFLSFFKGIASGLGVAVAVAIVIPLALAFMQSVDWVPLVGDFLSRVATHLQQEQQVRQR